MSEAEVIFNTPYPRTRQTLANDLQTAGVTPGMTVIVHSSLSSLGWVCGGAVTVVQALMDVITPEGTLVMPTHSGDYSDPAIWGAPPVPEDWWQIIREAMPVFDPLVTPTRGMGAIVEVFRTSQNVLRSQHPAVSFAAWGKHAKEVVANHSLDDSLGEGSPLSRLYELNGFVLLLGVGYDSCTCFHLAEYRVGKAQRITRGAPILEGGKRVWKTYRDIDYDTQYFAEIGTAFEKIDIVQISLVGSAQTKLFAVRNAVDFAVSWLSKSRA